MNMLKNFAADFFGTLAMSAALLALLCWDFGCALWRVVILGHKPTEQGEFL